VNFQTNLFSKIIILINQGRGALMTRKVKLHYRLTRAPKVFTELLFVCTYATFATPYAVRDNAPLVRSGTPAIRSGENYRVFDLNGRFLENAAVS
jgi:hypothetical protein